MKHIEFLIDQLWFWCPQKEYFNKVCPDIAKASTSIVIPLMKKQARKL